jgi:hypothetical protein
MRPNPMKWARKRTMFYIDYKENAIYELKKGKAKEGEPFLKGIKTAIPPDLSARIILEVEEEYQLFHILYWNHQFEEC